MVAPLDSTGFISDLKTEKITFEAFIEILKKEEQVLIQGKIDKIDDLVSDKSLLVEKLIQLAATAAAARAAAPDRAAVRIFICVFLASSYLNRPPGL